MSTIISISTTITQVIIDSYTFPVTINGGTLENPVEITFDEDLTISSISGYFIIDSDYIIINGQNNTVTITDIEDYPGLIQNGTNIFDAYSNVTVENIGILNSDTTTLLTYGGWLCQQYYGKRITTGTILVQNCYSTGIISGTLSGGICGPYFGFNASGDAELIIQN